MFYMTNYPRPVFKFCASGSALKIMSQPNIILKTHKTTEEFMKDVQEFISALL